MIRDPRGARRLTTCARSPPGGLLLDTGEFLLTFVPGGALGSFAAATGGRLILRGTDDAVRVVDDAAPLADDAVRAGDDVAPVVDDVVADLADSLGPLVKVNKPDRRQTCWPSAWR